MSTGSTFGDLLKAWRTRRRLSQLDLACMAETSTRHLSFLETGRANPSREMVLRLAEWLSIPLREQNRLLLAAGFAPVYSERPLNDPALQSARAAVDLVLHAQEPWPALAVDSGWRLVSANRALAPLLKGIASEQLQPPINVLRLSLHPAGLAPRILNYPEWRAHILTRLRREADASGQTELEQLHAELSSLPSPLRPPVRRRIPDLGGFVVPLVMETELGEVAMFSTTTLFGTPTDITLDEMALESFLPADPVSAERLRALFEAHVASDDAAAVSA